MRSPNVCHGKRRELSDLRKAYTIAIWHELCADDADAVRTAENPA